MKPSAMKTLRGLSTSRTKIDESLGSFLSLVKRRRAPITAEHVKLALSHRGLVRCLNKDGQVINDMDDVDKIGPVALFLLTPRGRARA